MKARDSLRRRIAGAYLLFALGSSVLFAILAAVAVEGIEGHLVDQRLLDVAKWASPRHAGGLPVAMPAGVSFHHGADIPALLRPLSPGVHEVHIEGVGMHVLAAHDKLGPYVVVDHDSKYEEIELVVYSLFALAFAGFLAFSLFLGGFIGSRFVTPITTLAAAVRDGSPELPLTMRTDELGVLARAFAEHTSELRGYLDRERFFTGDVSHELRTPLTVIIGAAEILAGQTAGQPALAAPVERILRAANEAAECVRVLLLLARSPELIPTVQTDIGEVVQADIARYQPLVENKPVRLGHGGGASFSVAGAPELCSAVVGNLIRNACQYTSAGQVLVSLRERSVIVEDTGPGLPAAVRATLGRATPGRATPGRAQRGPANTANTAGTGSSGTGIGLTLVRRICEHLGASMTLSDRPGGGSVFEITFPPVFTKS